MRKTGNKLGIWIKHPLVIQACEGGAAVTEDTPLGSFSLQNKNCRLLPSGHRWRVIAIKRGAEKFPGIRSSEILWSSLAKRRTGPLRKPYPQDPRIQILPKIKAEIVQQRMSLMSLMSRLPVQQTRKLVAAVYHQGRHKSMNNKPLLGRSCEEKPSVESGEQSLQPPKPHSRYKWMQEEFETGDALKVAIATTKPEPRSVTD